MGAARKEEGPVRRILLALASSAAILCSARADQSGSVEPYIDSIRSKLPPQNSTESYTEQEKKKLEQKGKGADDSAGYTEKIQQQLKAKEQTNGSENYTEKQKALLPPKEQGGAIQAVNEGHSDLRMIRSGNIHHAFGFKVNALPDFAFSSPTGAQFSNVYGSGFAPDLQFFYEYQPWHGENFASIAFFSMLDFSYHQGFGQFAVQLYNYTADPARQNISSDYFPTTSHTFFRFMDAGLTGGLTLHINAAKYVRPYASGGPTVMVFQETRDDGQQGGRGHAFGAYFAGGVNFLLDYVSRDATWQLYDVYGIKHYYFTVEYSRIQGLGGSVTLNTSGVMAGFTFEL